MFPGRHDWNTFDLALYAALSGCDYIPRLHRMTAKKIHEFLIQWKSNGTKRSLNKMLRQFSHDQHWPSGKNKPGAPATDYVEKVKVCLGMFQHPPVVSRVKNAWQITPLNLLPKRLGISDRV